MFTNILEMIGNTPLLKAASLETGLCTLFLKMESANPGGSIKDRIALFMINEAERKGWIKPGDTLIEATAGNTGVGLALVARQKGYDLRIVMPDKMSIEKRYCLQAMGAEVITTRSDVTKGHPEYYQDLAQKIALDSGAFYINQFCNQANVEAHYSTTGPEIWQQLSGEIDAFVCGVGTGGTLTGVGSYLKEVKPEVEVVLADPAGSILAPLVNEGRIPENIGSWFVEGIGEDFVPDICNLDLVDHAYSITDRESFNAARELLKKEGVMAGSSSGTLLSAAAQYCRLQTEPKNVVTLVCDTGNRYLSKLYNDDWTAENIRG